MKEKISKKKYMNLKYFEMIISPYEERSDDFFSKMKYRNMSNLAFYIEIPQLKLIVKRTFEDFEWLYKLITKNYNNPSIPRIPKSSFSLLGYKDSDLKNYGQKLENLMNYLVNIPTIKNTRVMFDFLTLQKNKDFQDLKKIYEKMKLSPLTKNDVNNDNNERLDEDIFTDNYKSSKGVLNEKDYKEIIEDPREIQSCSIYDSIINYLNQEDYSELRAFCFKCSKEPVNKEIMLNNLDSIYKEGKNNLYAKIDKFEILKIILFFDSKNRVENYKKMIELLKDINRVNNCTMDEYFTRINKFSEIIKERLFDINVLEKLGEENLRHIRTFIDRYYKGDEREAVDPYLKERYVDIINDYSEIICEKYKINKNKIIQKLKDLDKSEDMEDQMNHLIQSLDEHEKLYYDLLVQSILEAPSSDSAMKSWVIPIFKTIKDSLKTLVGTAIVSLTGSKILTAMAGTVGAACVISDISDIYMKKHYFSKNPEYRKLHHMNQRNSYDKRWNIMKRNIKEKYRKIINPIKNCYYHIVDRNLLKIKEEEKIGFDREEEIINIEEDTNTFITNFTNFFISERKEKVELNYYKNLMKMKTNLEKKKSKKYQEIKEEAEEREKATMNAIKEKIEKLGNEYPEYQENSLIKQKINSLVNIGLQAKNFVKTVFFKSSQKKMTNSEMRLELLNNYKYKEYLKRFYEIQEEKKLVLSKILENEVHCMCKLTKYDRELFQRIEQVKEEEKEAYESQISSLSSKDIQSKNDNIKENEKNNDENEDEDDKIEISSLDEPLIKKDEKY
jgi:hypothetical protein